MPMMDKSYLVGATVLFRYGDSHLYGEVLEVGEEESVISVMLSHRLRRFRIPNKDILHWYRF